MWNENYYQLQCRKIIPNPTDWPCEKTIPYGSPGVWNFFNHTCKAESLSNQVFREELYNKVCQIDAISDDTFGDVYELVWQARCDCRAWKD